MHQTKHLDDLSDCPVAHATVGDPSVLDAVHMVTQVIGVVCDDDAPLTASIFQMREIICRAQPRFDTGRDIDPAPAQRGGDERWNMLIQMEARPVTHHAVVLALPEVGTDFGDETR